MLKLRARLLFTLTSIAGLGVWAACGGDDNVTTAADAGTDTSVIDTYVPPVEDTGTVTTPPSGPDHDGGTPNVLDAGPDFDGGISCYEGGELEIEPNNDLTTATSFPTGSITGTSLKRILCGAAYNPTYVDGGDIDAGDNDYLTFQLGDASTNFYVSYEGQVAVTVETDGEAPVDITAPNASIKTFYKGQPYYVRVKSREGHTQKWKILVFQEQAPVNL